MFKIYIHTVICMALHFEKSLKFSCGSSIKMVAAHELLWIVLSEIGQKVITPEKVIIPDEEDEGIVHITRGEPKEVVGIWDVYAYMYFYMSQYSCVWFFCIHLVFLVNKAVRKQTAIQIVP